MSSQSEKPDLITLFQRGSMSTKGTPRDSKEAIERMWGEYEKEAEKYNEAITNAQKDADSILTGLYSAVVAMFVVEGYKKLSSDSGNTTTALLNQISRQLAGFQNNTYPPFQDTAAFSPSTAILFVNALWFLSLIMAIVSAFYVMLLQQWIRGYTQMLAETTREQRRIRSCLFHSTQKYHMPLAIKCVPLPLHVSVLLFFSGLIIFLFTISRAIAIVITIVIMFFVLSYVALTILPITDNILPFTPMSDVLWYLWHTFHSAAAICFHWLLGQIRRICDHLDPCHPSLGELRSSRPGKLSKWSKFLECAIEESRWCLMAGVRGNVFRHAIAAPLSVDLSALIWLLQRPTMALLSKFQEFVDGIPEQTLIWLSYFDAESGKKTILEHLSNLFRSCTGASKLEKPDRSTRLLTCLDAFHHIVKPSALPDEYYETVIGDVWSNFKDIKIVRELWDHTNPTIRVTSHSVCAYIARNLIRKPLTNLEESERRWLQEVLGKPESAIFDPLIDLCTREHLNLQSFVFGVLSGQNDGLSLDDATLFAETLAFLMNAGRPGALSEDIFSEEISSFIEWTERSDYERGDEVAAKLHEMFDDFLTTETTP